MGTKFKLAMISAMYENGGNTVHRFLDGHPGMFVYPFESQLGTKLVNDHLTSMFPVKYRWPEFALNATSEQDFLGIIDEETKVRARTPNVSKFRDMPFDFSDTERMQLFTEYVKQTGRTRGGNVEAFFRATFDAWKDYNRSGSEQVYLGYSPVAVIDAEKILTDLPDSHVIHVIRNPWSAYADTKKRPVPLPMHHYLLAWNLCQYFALLLRGKFPDRVHIVRLEDVLANPVTALGGICERLGLNSSETLRQPSWNGRVLEQVYPWGTIRKATTDANFQTAQELSESERSAVRAMTWQYLDEFGYANFLKSTVAAGA